MIARRISSYIEYITPQRSWSSDKAQAAEGCCTTPFHHPCAIIFSMWPDDDDEAVEEIEELYTITPVIDTDDEDDADPQYEDLDDEEFDIDF